jgi:hypothetical protein
MTMKINNPGTSNSFPSEIDIEFLEALLEPEDATYPWNPADEESETYFQELEQQFLMEDILEEDLTERSHAFYNQLDTLWSNINTNYYKCNPKEEDVTTLQKSLQVSFANRVPQDWLKAIAQKATEIFNSQQSLGEQLVECVQAVLPTWAAEDLLVLARPYAYAMRSGEEQNVESVLGNVHERDWSGLSEIEQARVSLAIAYYAFNRLNRFPEEV